MSTIKTEDGTHWGKGQPVVFSHGWPPSSGAWKAQMFFLASNGTNPDTAALVLTGEKASGTF